MLMLCSMKRLPLILTLFPYTTLFRSAVRIIAAVLESNYETISDLLDETGIIPVPYYDIIDIDSDDEARSAAKPADRKSTRLNSSHRCISYAVFCLKKKKKSKVHSRSK